MAQSGRKSKQSKQKSPKIIFVTGGVLSSLGKGLSSAALGLILKDRGLKVRHLKMDPYLNIDPGTMSPFQHGEVFVTEDGAETDLDLGHYERFLDENVTRGQNITAGQIYERVLARERKGDYLGGTVQVIPHVTDEIKKHLLSLAKGYDVQLVEIGGTVGDIESLPFLEAARQMRFDLGSENVMYIHVTLVPYIQAADELKTKPTQHSVQELRRIGIQPDILLCRADRELGDDLKRKIALFANMELRDVATARDVKSIYELPLLLKSEGVDERVCAKLGIKAPKAHLEDWKNFLDSLENADRLLRIGVIGKYVELKESYKSLHEALVHASARLGAKLEIEYIDSEKLEHPRYASMEARQRVLGDVHGILVPGGFGERGVEGKIRALEYGRQYSIPCFGICLGMQLMAVEFARNVLDLKQAQSEEFKKGGKFPNVIHYLPGQKFIHKGGSMRLGAFDCTIKKSTLAYKAYKKILVQERHRHRLEFNNKYQKAFEKNGMQVSGMNKAHKLIEMIELKNHPWYLGCQYHPEFKSRPTRAHPLFVEFLRASLKIA
ncbi:MAG: CTP synthase [Bdellovibrionota bacterium]